MNKKSLLAIKQAINEYLLEQAEINQQDCIELCINLNQFLEPKQYKENVKILESNRRRNGQV